MALARTTLIVPCLLAATIAAGGQATKPVEPVQAFPTSPIWTIEVSATPVAPPVSSAGRLYLALQSGVSAHRLDTHAEVWQTPIVVSGPMAASDERLIVAVKDELQGLDAATGAVVWTDRPGPLTAPPLVHGEWLLVASGEQVIGYRVLDGTRMWSRDTGAVEQRPAVAGTRVYVPAADGRIIALELASGEPVWEFDVGIRPTEPLVYGDRLFVGSAGKRFCSLFLDARKRRADWCYNDVGAVVVGRPAADDDARLLRRPGQSAARARSEERRVSLEEGPEVPAIGRSAARGQEPRRSRQRAARRRVRHGQGGQDPPADARDEAGDRAAAARFDRGPAGAHRGGHGRVGEGVERDARRPGAGRAAGAPDRAAHGAAGAGDPDWQAASSSRIVAASHRSGPAGRLPPFRPDACPACGEPESPPSE